MRIYRHLLGVAALLSAQSAFSFGTIPVQTSPDPLGYLIRAEQMKASENYIGVTDQLRQFLAMTGYTDPMLEAEALYNLGDVDCVRLLQDFIARHPASTLVDKARLLIGDYYFFEHDFATALSNYDLADFASLNADDRDTYLYRRSLCQVKVGLYHDARRGFKQLVAGSDFAAESRFYLAYIDYAEGDLDKAYDAFKNLAGSAPKYYIAQIDFKRGDFQDALDTALQLLDGDVAADMEPELFRIVGESYFKLGDKEQALPFLRRYVDNELVNPQASAVYDLAVILYEEDNLTKASELFGSIANEDNGEIGQSAWLYLGQCSAQANDNNGAAMAFRKAYLSGFDRNVSAAALYNYIASMTRGGNVPFKSSIPVLVEFIETYPDSEYAPDVERYLATAYYNEKDYAKALESINRISKPDAKTLAAKQKILYELGMQALSNDNARAARDYLTEARTLSHYNPAIGAQVELWLGDALYSLKQYDDAQKAYMAYLKADKKGENRALALYNAAYAAYMKDDFNTAMTLFDEAIKANPGDVQSADALIRKADCLYYTGNLNTAAQLYSSAMESGAADADYAALRKAIIAGVNGDNDSKIQQLHDMRDKYPNTKWAAVALVEEGIALTESGKNDKAIQVYKDLIEKYPASAEARNALLQVAQLYDEEGDRDNAVEAYRQVISRWPTSEQASLANDDLRVIYADMGMLSDYADFLKSIPGAPQLDEEDIERLTFDAAATAYGAEKGSIDKMRRYIEQYPDGAYLAQALRDVAQYEAYEEGNLQAALGTVNDLLRLRPDAPQIPGALLLKGQILERLNATPNEILDTYNQLEQRGGADYAAEAWAGIMRNTTSPSVRIQYARRIAQTGGLAADVLEEASYYEALGLADEGDTAAAREIYRRLAENPQSLYGAKAAVALGRSLIDSRQYAKAVDELTAFTDSGTPHQYELALGYVALADAYNAQGKRALAIEYLESLRENYPGKEADIRQMIDKRLKAWKK